MISDKLGKVGKGWERFALAIRTIEGFENMATKQLFHAASGQSEKKGRTFFATKFLCVIFSHDGNVCRFTIAKCGCIHRRSDVKSWEKLKRLGKVVKTEIWQQKTSAGIYGL